MSNKSTQGYLPLIISAVLFALSAYGGYNVLIQQPQQQRYQQLAQQLAEEKAAVVNHYLATIEQRVANLAHSDSLRQLLTSHNEVLAAAAESQLHSAFPALLAYRPIPLGSAKLDSEHAVPIRFTELDMINRAESGEQVHAEAVNSGQGWIVQLVQPVVDRQQQIVGSVLLSFNLHTLEQKLQGDGTVAITQRFAATPAKHFIQLGTGSSAISAQAATANPLWTVQFSPSQQQLAAYAASWQTLGLNFAGAGLLALLGLLVARKVFKSQHAKTQRAQSNQILLAKNRQKDILDIDVLDEDRHLVRRNPKQSSQAVQARAAAVAPAAARAALPEHIFRDYDIRGVADAELSEALVENIGKAIGSEALDCGQGVLALARDGRNSSPRFRDLLAKGITSTGCNVIDIGAAPSPLLYFATHHLDGVNSGVVVTASHNPPQFNGFKIVMDGKAFADQDIQALKSRIVEERFHQGQGKVAYRDISQDYIERISSDIALDGQKVVIDAGNGIAGDLAVRLFEELGCDVTPLHCEVDGNFPNHPADPSIGANLQDLVTTVKAHGADIGIALDGDGDRLGVVSASGRILWADQLLMILSRDVATRNPGADILFDVKCSRHLTDTISAYGGRPLMWKCGHSHMKRKMQASGALLGGEYSGHIFFKERWYGFDDGLYSAARLLEIMTIREQDLDTMLANLPRSVSTPMIDVAVPESEKFALMEKLAKQLDFPEGKVSTIDGVRLDLAQSWGLVRSSNTSANLTLRFEADTDQALDHVKSLFRSEIQRVAPDLALNF